MNLSIHDVTDLAITSVLTHPTSTMEFNKEPYYVTSLKVQTEKEGEVIITLFSEKQLLQKEKEL